MHPRQARRCVAIHQLQMIILRLSSISCRRTKKKIQTFRPWRIDTLRWEKITNHRQPGPDMKIMLQLDYYKRVVEAYLVFQKHRINSVFAVYLFSIYHPSTPDKPLESLNQKAHLVACGLQLKANANKVGSVSQQVRHRMTRLKVSIMRMAVAYGATSRNCIYLQ